MTREEAAQAIRTQMNFASGSAKTFWKGVLVGFACGDNINIQLMKDLAEKQDDSRMPICEP